MKANGGQILLPALHWFHLNDLAPRYVDMAPVSELVADLESCRQEAA